MQKKLLIMGAGIGGLAAALAAHQAGWSVQLLERVARFAPVGAGVQLGPNVTRHLRAWALQPQMQALAAYPARLLVRDAATAAVLATVPLGQAFEQRYGAPYITMHRADLHQLLLAAVERAGCDVQCGQEVVHIQPSPVSVALGMAGGGQLHADALVGADGLWSQVAAQALAQPAPHYMGHIAYRALVPQALLPAAMRTTDVTVWLGPCLHVVQYPVQAGHALNMVVIEHAQQPAPVGSDAWQAQGSAQAMARVVQGMCAPLQDRVHAVAAACPQVGAWSLYARAALTGPGAMAQGRIALLGDAAHPMLPYLAQGAGMAIEDAAQLQCSLRVGGGDAAAQLAHYAHHRWRRNAAVQARAQRNGRIFHLRGVPAWGRNWALRAIGAPLVDMPWLYGGGEPVATPLS